MSATPGLILLVQRLRTDSALQGAFLNDAVATTEGFGLTAHERDAVVTRDLDDFVAIGVVSTISELPAVLRGRRPRGLGALLANLQDALMQLLGRPPQPVPRPRPRPPRPLPNPPGPPGPHPGPGPRPGPEPGPGPRPGPDPPGPDF
jgi:hypothetical protein